MNILRNRSPGFLWSPNLKVEPPKLLAIGRYTELVHSFPQIVKLFKDPGDKYSSFPWDFKNRILGIPSVTVKHNEFITFASCLWNCGSIYILLAYSLICYTIQKSISLSVCIKVTMEKKKVQLMVKRRKVIEAFAGWEGRKSMWLTLGLAISLKSKGFSYSFIGG